MTRWSTRVAVVKSPMLDRLRITATAVPLSMSANAADPLPPSILSIWSPMLTWAEAWTHRPRAASFAGWRSSGRQRRYRRRRHRTGLRPRDWPASWPRCRPSSRLPPGLDWGHGSRRCRWRAARCRSTPRPIRPRRRLPRHRGRHRPGSAVPVLNQGPSAAGVGVVSDRPCVTRREHGHTRQVVVVRSRAGGFAITVQRRAGRRRHIMERSFGFELVRLAWCTVTSQLGVEAETTIRSG